MYKSSETCLMCGMPNQHIQMPEKPHTLTDIGKFAGMNSRGHTPECQEKSRQMMLEGLSEEGSAVVDSAFSLGLMS